MNADEFIDKITDMFITTTQWYEIQKEQRHLDKMDDIMDAAEKADAWAEFCVRLEEKGFEIEKELKRLELWK